MEYILTSLNQTSSKATAVRNYIRMAFGIDPREIRYDSIPSIDTRINNVIPEEREILIRERLESLLSSISTSIGAPVSIINIESTNDRMLINLRVAEEVIDVKI